MPRAFETILEAGLSYREGWENRLTAILATVLDQHWGFASALFERVGLPTGDAYEAYTEEWVTADRRVDMQVLAKDTKGAVIAQIWSEHKRAGGAFGTTQREDYLAALEREPGKGRLLTVVADVRAEDPSENGGENQLDPGSESRGPSAADDDELAERPGEPSPEEPRWWGLTWQLLGEIADGAGQAWGGPNWASKALMRSAPAEQRSLYELLWYLDQEGYAVVSPLADEHIQSLKHTSDTFDVTMALLSRAADGMTPLVPDGAPALDPDFSGYAQDFEIPAGAWPERVDGAVELLIWDDDGWIDKPAGEPSVAIGVSIEPEWYRPLAKKTEWVHRVRGAGYCFTEYDDWVCCYATIPLRDVVEKGGDTLAEQAGYVASWAAPLARQLLSEDFDPGPVERPAKPRRG